MGDELSFAIQLPDDSIVRAGDVVSVRRTRQVIERGNPEAVEKDKQFYATFKYAKNGVAYLWKPTRGGAGWRSADFDEISVGAAAPDDDVQDVRTPDGLAFYMVSSFGAIPVELTVTDEQAGVSAEGRELQGQADRLRKLVENGTSIGEIIDACGEYLDEYEVFYEAALS